MSIKSIFKKMLHQHKFTTLLMYPPRPKYYTNEWGFLLRCDCGYTKLAKLPRSVVEVFEVRSKEKEK